MKKIVSIIGVVLIIAAILGSSYIHSKNQKLQKYEAQFMDVFDTVTKIIGYAKTEEEFSRQTALIKKELKRYNDLYDIYHNYEGLNNLKTINDNAGIQPVKVETEIIELLKLGREMYEESRGQLNIAYGSVLEVWHTYRERGMDDPEHAEVPPMEILKEKAEHTDINQVIIDEEASTVYLKDPKMSLDVGSIGKGYGVQRAAEYAKKIGVDNVLLSVGGNICAVGTRIDGSRWRLGIQNPDTESSRQYVQKIDLKDQCVVTSGNYQRYYEVDGVRYCHIIDPDTRMPADYFASVSVVTDDSGMADALSTILYNMDYNEGRAYVEALEHVEAMWIMEDGSRCYSSGFEELMADNGQASD